MAGRRVRGIEWKDAIDVHLDLLNELNGAAVGNRPVKLALLIRTAPVSTKSSAPSISI